MDGPLSLSVMMLQQRKSFGQTTHKAGHCLRDSVVTVSRSTPGREGAWGTNKAEDERGHGGGQEQRPPEIKVAQSLSKGLSLAPLEPQIGWDGQNGQDDAENQDGDLDAKLPPPP